MPRITDGYGEYVIMRKRFVVTDERTRAAETRLAPLGRVEFEGIQREVIHDASPFRVVHDVRALVTQERLAPGSQGERIFGDMVEATCARRWDSIRQGLRTRALPLAQPGETYEAVFIPRTLYELVYLNELMAQELAHATFAAWPVKPMAQYEGAIVDPARSLDAENLDLGLLVNNLIVAKLAAHLLPRRGGGGGLPPVVRLRLELPLERADLEALLAQELARYRALVGDARHRLSGYRFLLPNGHYSADPEKLGTRLRARGTLADQADALCAALEQTMAIEVESAGKLLLYRGTEFAMDSMAAVNGSNGFPVSYNTGLFATLVYDRSMVTSTPSFMLERPTPPSRWKYGYCLAIPYRDLISSAFPFHVPLTNTLKQLHGIDQPSHAWSKTITSYYVNQLGMPGANALPAHSHLRYMQYPVNDLNTLNAAFVAYQVPYDEATGAGHRRTFYMSYY